ncbi:TetR/AcrR family transcriptional regulator [Nonomuraea sp. NBC_01738]|uniref:TetR/AcrR family transcriptional regulator n=1 Tax=Nonomuraea sp. NBC_01738 TaxID=2976003 RepID=UPI002E0D33B3|nr:TetR/AcrR family transcriptional regulator [Nonomuraea sp. NBC_01738]
MPRRADAARNAEALLATARAVFAEQGSDASLDDIAKRAGVGNATLYRHFPTRADLLAAVYAEEVSALCAEATNSLNAASPADALFTWLDHFVTHVATKRPLALAITESRQPELFARWHRSLHDAAALLLTRAHLAGSVADDLTVTDLLALTSATAMATTDPAHARRLLHTLRHGIER